MLLIVDGKFTVVPTELVKGLNPYQQTIYFWLCHHSDKKGKCWPSMELLSKECGISRMSVMRYIKTLEDLNLIKKTKRKKVDGSHSSNIYQLIIPKEFLKQEEDKNQLKSISIEDISDVEHEDEGTEKNVITISEIPSNSEPSPVASESSHNQNHYELKPIIKNNNICSSDDERECKSDYKNGKTSHEGEDLTWVRASDKKKIGFEEFWSKYPRKQSKRIAMKKWLRDECYKIADVILYDIDVRLGSEWKNLSKTYIPLPSTYLNQARYDDEEIIGHHELPVAAGISKAAA